MQAKWSNGTEMNTQYLLLLQFKSVTEDIATERETYAQSRQGLDSLYIDVQKKLQDESTARQVHNFKPLFQKQMVRSAGAHTLRNTLI